MKKNILVVIDALRMGGIRSSLINLLNSIDLSVVDITLYIFNFDNEDLEVIPEEVKVLHGGKLLKIAATTSSELSKKSYLKYLIRKIMAIFCTIINSNVFYGLLFKLEKRFLDYDVAISYTNNVSDHSLYFGANKFVLEKVKAKKKIAWIHADYERMRLNTEINNKEYRGFDRIVAVSISTKDAFLKYNSYLKDKTCVIYNLIDERKINFQKNEYVQDSFKTNTFKIVSVCRLDQNKSPEVILEICKVLKAKSLQFEWIVVGDGPMFSQMQKKVREYDLNKCLKFVGYQYNPYPYLKQANLFVSTSKSEGYSMAVAEALYIQVPVLCGWYESIHEAIENNGIIVQNKTEHYVSELEKLIRDEEKYKQLKEQSKLLKGNEEILKEVYQLI